MDKKESIEVDVRTIRRVDTREPGDLRTALLQIGWIQEQLYYGDYFFFSNDYKKVGITRKTVDDLLASLSGHKMPSGQRQKPFPKQLEEMLDEYPIKIILLEGSWNAVTPARSIVTSRGTTTYHTWSMVWDFIRRWQDKGFTLELTINKEHTIHRLNELYALYQKPYSLSSMTKDYTDDRVLAFPSGCRGKTGQSVLNKLGSLKNLANVSEDRLIQIDGIGKKKANMIFLHFNKGQKEVNEENKSKDIKQQTPIKTNIIKTNKSILLDYEQKIQNNLL